MQYNNLAATTGDAGMLVKNASSHLSVLRDLLVFGVDDDGDHVALDSGKIYGFQSWSGGQLLHLQIHPKTSINLRFNWGHMENGVWTPDALSWLVFTFMDLDAGYSTWAAETLSTSDASRYTAGASITVDESNSSVSFATYVEGATPNPTSRILTEDQLLTAGSMEFENKEHFTLSYQNAAQQVRSLFLTGITNLNWQELEPCPTPAPTASSPESYCVGSGQSCGGNVCCPGFEDTCGKSFPCPEADPAFYDQCEIPDENRFEGGVIEHLR